MNKLYYLYIWGLFFVVFSSSCKKKFLEKAPGVDVTENTIFSSKQQLETYVASTYRHGIHTGFPNDDQSLNSSVIMYDMICAATDEAEMAAGWLVCQRWNTGNISADEIVVLEDSRYFLRWRAIRMANIILERIGEVPGLDQVYKDQVVGEVKFIRALNNFEMFKRYGGFPIVDHRYLPSDEVKVKRGTVEECMNFIVNDCSDAAGKLPVTYPSTMRGRATKGAALALKSKALLFAASPLFNASQPYLSLGDNNKLICYGDEKKERWKAAADAAKAALDWASQAGCTLITDKGVTENYRYQWETNDNAEIILANKSFGIKYTYDLPWATMKPNTTGGWAGIMVTHNFVRKYEKQDGTPQIWDPAGGNDLMDKYDELDPRFKQTVAYQDSYWNVQNPVFDVKSSIGGWMHKGIPRALDYSRGVIPNWQVFKLAEIYLNYAEALNESDGPVQAAYDAVNAIRARSGMPDLPAGLDQADFRTRVHHERDIELAFDDHRFWDIRRWKIAEEDGVMKGDFWGLKIAKVGVNNGKNVYSYLPYIFEQRTFFPKMYLDPFVTSEVNKGYLVQNPGW